MIKVAIIGVGNCASSLVQGIAYCRAKGDQAVGVPFPTIGRYKPSDVTVACAFEVDARKVGQDLADAIFAEPNCTTQFWPDIAKTGVIVRRGPTLDGVSAFMAENPPDVGFVVSDEREPTESEVVAALGNVDVVINFLPVGSQIATEFYANCAIKAGAAFVNGIPVFIASNPQWAARFADAGLPVLGDDFKAQLGATIMHRTFMHLFDQRGGKVDRTYQLNVGGNTDFLNMMSPDRLSSKRISKTEAVQSAHKERLKDSQIRVGPSDYVAWLNDQKVAYIRLEGQLFGGVPIHVETRLSVEDSPNAAAMALIAIRCARIALDQKISGPVDEVCGFIFKSPPKQIDDTVAHAAILQFSEKAASSDAK